MHISFSSFQGIDAMHASGLELGLGLGEGVRVKVKGTVTVVTQVKENSVQIFQKLCIIPEN